MSIYSDNSLGAFTILYYVVEKFICNFNVRAKFYIIVVETNAHSPETHAHNVSEIIKLEHHLIK